MRTTACVLVLWFAAGCTRQDRPAAPVAPPAGSPSTAADRVEVDPASRADDPAEEAESPAAAAEPVVSVDELLQFRLEGGMQHNFGQFANMFVVISHLQLPRGVGLMSTSSAIIETELQSPFPGFYHPTLREFLNAIALQTFSQWQHDPSGKFIKSEVEIPADRSPVFFEFSPTERDKPFAVTLADQWTSNDKGHWVMLVPPIFPVGMDIYEMGTYSPPAGESSPEFFDKVRSEVALEWAHRVDAAATADDLQPAQVGMYAALHFDKLLTGQNNKQIRWRHWVFMVKNQCYFVVSTILPELEDRIFPDVQQMLESFQVKPAAGAAL